MAKKETARREEKRFYRALKDVFLGAEVEGESGFINLVKIKSAYYERGVFPRLKADIEHVLSDYPHFRPELFQKLYNFFNRYFSESGSIYFSYTPVDQSIYDKVYADDKDVMLFWKTHMLYYVKTDMLFKSLDFQVDGLKFLFDASGLEHKKANERRQVVCQFKEKRKDGTLVFCVSYSVGGSKTKIDEVMTKLRKEGLEVGEDVLERAIRIFVRQNEVDYFINKDAKAFLKEQFELWLYRYVFSGPSKWTEQRIGELQELRNIAFKIIDFISQFEDELVKIWEKPKLVLNSNYVVTLDRIASEDMHILRKILKHKNFKFQCKEWRDLGITDSSFKKGDLVATEKKGEKLSDRYRHLPIDTKHFKDIELDILHLFDPPDRALDGWLIKSENFQALNTILPKFAGRVQVIYVDPPFNTGDDFLYVDHFQDSSWLTLLRNRLEAAQRLLHPTGSLFLHLDWNANYLGRCLLDEIFGKDNFLNEIVWRIGWVSGYKTQAERFVRNHDTLLFYAAEDRKATYFDKGNANIPYVSFETKTIKPEISSILTKWSLLPKDVKNAKIVFKDRSGRVYKTGLKAKEWFYPIEDTWNCSEYEELHSNKIKRNAKEYTPNGSEITQKPEQLLRRVVELTTKRNDLVLDFFLGSGTSIAVAHKLGRKWIGVEMASYFETDALYRMKHVLAGATKHEPCGVTKDVGWQGGGFFKYYELEQYENALRKVKYEDSDLFEDPSQTPYEQYVFMRDLKMLEALEVDIKENKVRVDLNRIYPAVDIAETLSNLTGKWIKRLTLDTVEFEDGEKLSIEDLDYRLIKPLIWW